MGFKLKSEDQTQLFSHKLETHSTWPLGTPAVHAKGISLLAHNGTGVAL